MGIGNPDRAPVPTRHWRSYGNDPLPTGQEALDEPFRAFPSWFLRIECDRCGKVQMVQRGACCPMAGPDAAGDPRPDASRRLRRIVQITNPMLAAAPIRRR
jgi:hypothetical protein